MPTWAKAPDFADQPRTLARVRAGTAADRDDYLRSGLCPIQCGRCATWVLAKKNSPQHTSIQWTAEGIRQCAELAARAPGEVVETCPALQASIDAAARDGRLAMPQINGDRRAG
ncbi:hypothetical protein MOQ72_11690 [Saccharopolyspora sp. K220]|uniref:hypothetical protein n=1 Tax=Saccharopolyspora soli TaxID=2926618 RepID=UPI001F569370|nr:hypothetical protein [Saccharopolyspora soli]MCI2418089.1 hypothetical protein [Saccharopolyspora soli]